MSLRFDSTVYCRFSRENSVWRGRAEMSPESWSSSRTQS